MQIDTIRERFARPPAEFGPTPFWFLNDELDEERLSNDLKEMKSKGIAGVIIHPRTGMEVEYLSETFWEKMLFICETLRRLRMQGWIYDEYNWPSGPVGGKLLREHPEFKQSGLDYRLMPSSEVQGFVQNPANGVVAAYAVSEGDLSDRTEELKEGNVDAFGSGESLLFFLREVREPMAATCGAPWTKGETGYLDLLNPSAVDEFMRLTHLEYDRRLKEYYGSPIVGIFTDEPANYFGLPYTRGLPEAFHRRFGRELRDALPSLAGRFPGISIEDYVRNRSSYFELVRDMYVESFFRKISRWASERGLIFTGHLNDDDDIGRLPATNTSFYAPLSQMQMPGTDVLCDGHGYEKEHPALVHANFNPKALSSTAHHCGAERTLCEIWGGNGWASPPEKLKAVLNWAQACGVNFVNPHAAYTSLRGHRKRDFPSSHFPPQPWWCFYDKFSEYIARLSFLNSSGIHVAEVLFAFSLKSLWTNFDLRAKRDKLADFIEAASETLLRNQLDFDYLFDEVLDSKEVGIEEGHIGIRGEKYSLLILTLAAVIPAKLLELAEQFAEAGGRIIAIGYEMPKHDEYGGEVSERVEALFGEKEPAGVAHRQLGVDVNSDMNWLAKKAKQCIRQDLIAEGPLARNLAYLHRRVEDADFYFVANLSDDEGQTELAFRCRGRPQLWDPEDGSTKNILAYRTGAEYTRMGARFGPNQAFFFVFTDEPPVDHVDSTNLNLTSVSTDFANGYTSALEVRLSRGTKRYTRNVEKALPPIFLPERWEIDYPVRNIMLLDKWEVEILSKVEPSTWSPGEDPRLGFRARLIIEAVRAGFALGRTIKRSLGKSKLATTKYEPIYESIDAAEKWSKWLGIDTAQFDEAEGVLLKLARHVGLPIGYDYPPRGCAFAMSTVFHLDHIPDDLALVYERLGDGPNSVRINDAEVGERPEPTFVWDASNLTISIGKLVKEGENRLRLEWRQPDFPTCFPSVHGIEPVCLTGRFWVKKGRIVEQKYRAPALPWDQIGLPNYIGTLSYKSSFELPMNYMGQQLFLKIDRVGTAAEVKVNGKHAGVILWRPYVLDVTALLVQGENSIEVTVANTAANLLANPVPAGLMGRPYIVPYWRHRIRLES